MGKHRLHIGQLCPRHTKQRVIHRKKGLCHDVIVVAGQQVIHVDDGSRRGILNRHHRVIRVSQLHFLHGILETCHMIDFGIFTEILNSGRMAVSALHALVHHTHALYRQLIQALKPQLHGPAMLRQNGVLILAADGHHLGEQLPHRHLVKFAVCHGADRIQLLLLTLRVINGLSGSDLGFCHLAADVHALLK